MPFWQDVSLNESSYFTKVYHSELYQYRQSDLTYYNNYYTYNDYNIKYYNANQQNKAYFLYINKDYKINEEKKFTQQTDSQIKEKNITEAYYIITVKSIYYWNYQNHA